MTGERFEYRPDGLRKIDSDEADPFGHRDYAAAITAALELLPPRFTMGLFGPWGSGKSTILEEVRRRITAESADVKSGFVLFDAWRYEGDSLRREFLKVSGRSLLDQKLVSKSVVEGLDESLDVDEVTPTRPSLRLLDPELFKRAAVGAAAVAGVVLAAIFGLPQLGLQKETVLAFLLATSSALTAFGLLSLQPVMSPTPIQKTRRRAEFPDEFSAAFRNLLDNVGAARLVFAIDNLDRCSPARVTQTLATVKTFLEPALGEGGGVRGRTLKQVCFIVAADDNALRRHLTAQELSESGLLSGADSNEGGDAELPREVREAVDEYLRKFFGASVRIRDVLDEDISRFSEGEFAGFFIARPELDAETRRDLIEMVSQALKRNPRRIVQFVNNLALRLDLLDERVNRERILIEPDVLVVAKLAILEEEFPERFAELKETPQVLDTWEGEARSPDGEEFDDEEEGAGWSKKSERERLSDFLRFTDHVRSRHLRAYLDLKQTRDELQLDRHAELVDLLDGGDVAGVRSLLDEVGNEEALYVRATERHFHRQVRLGNWGKAHNVLRAVSEVPALQGDDGAVGGVVIDESLSHPRLSRRLPLLDADAVLTAARRALPKSKLNRLVLALSAGMEEPGDSDGRRRIADGVSRHHDVLTNGTVAALQRILGRDEIQGDFRSYVNLAEAVPAVTGPAIAAAALEQLQASTDEQRGNGPELRVAAIAVGKTVRDEEFTKLLELGMTILGRLLSEASDEYAEVVHSFRALLRLSNETIDSRADDLPGEAERATFCATLVDNWASLPEGSKWEAMQLGYEFCSAGVEADSQRGFEWGQKVLDVEDGVDVEAWLMARLGEMPPRFSEAVLDELANAVAGARRSLPPEKAQRLIDALPDDQRNAVGRMAVLAAVAENRADRVDDLLERLPADGVASAVAEIAQRLASNPAELPEREREVGFLIANQGSLDEQVPFDLAMGLAQAADETRDLAISVASFIGRLKIKDPEKRLEVVQRVLRIEADMSATNNRIAMLKAATAVAGRRSSHARSAAVGRLRERLGADDAEVADAAKQMLAEIGETGN